MSPKLFSTQYEACQAAIELLGLTQLTWSPTMLAIVRLVASYGAHPRIEGLIVVLYFPYKPARIFVEIHEAWDEVRDAGLLYRKAPTRAVLEELASRTVEMWALPALPTGDDYISKFSDVVEANAEVLENQEVSK